MEKPSVATHTLEITRKILKRDLMDVNNVVVPSVLCHILKTITEPITERKLTNAVNAANSFTPLKVLKDIRAFMLQKKLVNVKSGFCNDAF